MAFMAAEDQLETLHERVIREYDATPRIERKKHKSLLKFLAVYPDDFQVRRDEEKKGLYWVRLLQNNT